MRTGWYFFKKLWVYLFIYFWLCWVFVSVRGLSLVAASGGHSSSRCAGLSLSRPLLLRSTGSRSTGSVIVAHGPSCSAACGIFPDQGSNPCPLHWQADSQPLRHQGSPRLVFLELLPFWWAWEQEYERGKRAHGPPQPCQRPPLSRTPSGSWVGSVWPLICGQLHPAAPGIGCPPGDMSLVAQGGDPLTCSSPAGSP